MLRLNDLLDEGLEGHVIHLVFTEPVGLEDEPARVEELLEVLVGPQTVDEGDRDLLLLPRHADGGHGLLVALEGHGGVHGLDMLFEPGTDHGLSTVTEEEAAYLRLELALEELDGVLPGTRGELVRGTGVLLRDLQLDVEGGRVRDRRHQVIVLVHGAGNGGLSSRGVLSLELGGEGDKSAGGAGELGELRRGNISPV